MRRDPVQVRAGVSRPWGSPNDRPSRETRRRRGQRYDRPHGRPCRQRRLQEVTQCPHRPPLRLRRQIGAIEFGLFLHVDARPACYSYAFDHLHEAEDGSQEFSDIRATIRAALNACQN